MAALLKPKQNARRSISASVMAVSPRFSYFWKITPYDLKRHCVKGCFCKVYWAVHTHSCIMGNQGKMAGNSKAATSSRIHTINAGCLCEKSTLRVQLYLKSGVQRSPWSGFKKLKFVHTFSVLFCNFDNVELQKMYGNIMNIMEYHGIPFRRK